MATVKVCYIIRFSLFSHHPHPNPAADTHQAVISETAQGRPGALASMRIISVAIFG